MDTVPAWFAVVVTLIGVVLGISIGVLGSHASLGNKVTRALTLLEDLARRVGVLEDPNGIHFHRRATDKS